MGECFFWYRPIRVVPDQRPLNGRCCCCCSMSFFRLGDQIIELYSRIRCTYTINFVFDNVLVAGVNVSLSTWLIYSCFVHMTISWFILFMDLFLVMFAKCFHNTRWIEQGLTSHSTQNRSFRRRLYQPISWLST